MRNRTATTLALGTATALGLLASAAQAESLTPAAGQPVAKGPMLLTAEQMDAVTAGQSTGSASTSTSFSASFSTSQAQNLVFSFSGSTSASTSLSIED